MDNIYIYIAKNTLTLFCITINDLPSKTNINDFVLYWLVLNKMNFMGIITGLQQFKESNKY